MRGLMLKILFVVPVLLLSAVVFATEWNPEDPTPPAGEPNLFLKYAPDEGALLEYYACTRGKVREACARLDDNPFMAYGPDEGALLDFYACTRGSVASACDRLNGRSNDARQGSIAVNYRACTMGHVQSVCENLGIELSAPVSIDAGGLPDFYACSRGHFQPACDRLNQVSH